jgi:hypothetical protein
LKDAPILAPFTHEHYKRHILLPFNGTLSPAENESRTLSEAVGFGELVAGSWQRKRKVEAAEQAAGLYIQMAQPQAPSGVKLLAATTTWLQALPS